MAVKSISKTRKLTLRFIRAGKDLKGNLKKKKERKSCTTPN